MLDGMYLDSAGFPFIPGLEAAWRGIHDECLALPDDSFAPWVQREMYGTGWSVHGLVGWGHELPAALARCPRTAAALRAIPGLRTAGFSRLAAGARIAAHVGWVTDIHRLHLGLVVPPGCAMRVGDETRAWQEGRCLAFDDTTDHEAWNDSSADRYVLLFDILRPGCTPESDEFMPLAVRRMLAEHLRRDGGG